MYQVITHFVSKNTQNNCVYLRIYFEYKPTLMKIQIIN